MNDRLYNLHCRLNSLVIFKDILNCRTIQSLDRLFESMWTESTIEQVRAYSDFVSNLYRHHNDLSSYILTLILEDENIYMIRKSLKLSISDKMHDCLVSELESLQMIAELKSEEIRNSIDYDGFLPDWDNSEYDFKAEYKNRVDNIDRYG